MVNKPKRRRGATTPRRLAYQKFLTSAAWAIKREQVLTVYGHICYACRKVGHEVHHTTYEFPLGREPIRIFRVMCNKCHREIHRIHRAGGRKTSLLEVTEGFAKAKRKKK